MVILVVSVSPTGNRFFEKVAIAHFKLKQAGCIRGNVSFLESRWSEYGSCLFGRRHVYRLYCLYDIFLCRLQARSDFFFLVHCLLGGYGLRSRCLLLVHCKILAVFLIAQKRRRLNICAFTFICSQLRFIGRKQLSRLLVVLVDQALNGFLPLSLWERQRQLIRRLAVHDQRCCEHLLLCVTE